MVNVFKFSIFSEIDFVKSIFPAILLTKRTASLFEIGRLFSSVKVQTSLDDKSTSCSVVRVSIDVPYFSYRLIITLL